MRVQRLIIFLLAMLSASCATNGPDLQIIDTSCSWVKPIYISWDDKFTDQTAKQILAHNKAWAATCRDQPKPSGAK